jgi:hypothetical protein
LRAELASLLSSNGVGARDGDGDHAGDDAGDDDTPAAARHPRPAAKPPAAKGKPKKR